MFLLLLLTGVFFYTLPIKSNWLNIWYCMLADLLSNVSSNYWSFRSFEVPNYNCGFVFFSFQLYKFLPCVFIRLCYLVDIHLVLLFSTGIILLSFYNVPLFILPWSLLHLILIELLLFWFGVFCCCCSFKGGQIISSMIYLFPSTYLCVFEVILLQTAYNWFMGVLNALCQSLSFNWYI